MELIACPECAEPAETQREADLNGTDGPDRAHAKTLCARRHRFLVPLPVPRSTARRAASCGGVIHSGSDQTAAAACARPRCRDDSTKTKGTHYD
jgi:hypothetical protein